MYSNHPNNRAGYNKRAGLHIFNRVTSEQALISEQGLIEMTKKTNFSCRVRTKKTSLRCLFSPESNNIY